MINNIIIANVLTLAIGLYLGNDIFIYMSTGSLFNLTLLSYMEMKK